MTNLLKQLKPGRLIYLQAKRFVILSTLITGLFLQGTTFAAGLLTPKGSSLDTLKIRQHHVNVTIEDGYAITRIEQVFHNPHDHDLEAVYSFPVPEHGSVAEFTLWIDGKPVTGEVLEKNQARRVYEEEKQAGRDAGLTEKNAYKTFEISVSPVRAKQDTRIRLVYLQPAHVDTGVGRYVYPLEDGGVDEQQRHFWSSNERVEEVFSFDLTVKSAYPVAAVRVPNHKLANITQMNNGEWHVNLSSHANTAPPQEEAPPKLPTVYNAQTKSAFSLDQDIVVYWRHADGLPGSVDLVAYKPDANGRGTFMMTVTPGDDLEKITTGSDWIFVLDISGSMQGKYATLANSVQQALKKMRVEDRFRIITFNTTAKEITSGYVNATAENVRYYAEQVATVHPGQGTNLFAGLNLGLDSIDADRATGIILVTDGVANVGVTQQKQFINLIKRKDMRLFTFIMGNSSNRPLLEAVTKASGGFALNVSNNDDIMGNILLATGKLQHKALHGVQVEIDGVKTADLSPNDIGSLYRGQQLVLFGHYWGDGLATVRVKGRISGQPKVYQTQFSFPETATQNPEIERLWAYATIEDLAGEIEDFGENADYKQAIVDLGKEFSLVTDYTSMVVLRDEVYTSRGIDRANQRRLNIEHQAQQQRSQQPAQSRRVDNHQPMYTSKRPSLSGGALGPWALLLLPAVVWYRKKRR